MIQACIQAKASLITNIRPVGTRNPNLERSASSSHEWRIFTKDDAATALELIADSAATRKEVLDT